MTEWGWNDGVGLDDGVGWNDGVGWTTGRGVYEMALWDQEHFARREAAFQLPVRLRRFRQRE